MITLQVASLLIVLAGAFSYFFLRLPQSIGILVVALFASFGVIGLDYLMPELAVADANLT